MAYFEVELYQDCVIEIHDCSQNMESNVFRRYSTRSQQYLTSITQSCYPHSLMGLHSHVTSPESENGVYFRTANLCTDSATTFVAPWTISKSIMVSATLNAAS